MQAIQDFCLITIMMNAIFRSQSSHSHDIVIPPNILSPLEFNASSPDSHLYDSEVAAALLTLSLAITYSTYVQKPFRIPNVDIINTLEFHVCPVLSTDNSGSFGVIIYHHDIMYIIFSGTADTCMTSVDLTYRQNPLTLNNCTPDMKSHQGFNLAYSSIRDPIINAYNQYQPSTLYITGHSLGAALSTLCALDFASVNPIHYSFASPMVFNPSAAITFNQLLPHSYRIANISDLVTIAPLPIMPNNDLFAHVGNTIIFQTNTGDYLANHTLAYMEQYNISHN